jgi:hypothetical protein
MKMAKTSSSGLKRARASGGFRPKLPKSIIRSKEAPPFHSFREIYWPVHQNIMKTIFWKMYWYPVKNKVQTFTKIVQTSPKCSLIQYNSAPFWPVCGFLCSHRLFLLQTWIRYRHDFL